MAEIHRVGRIELSDDYRFTRKSWVMERTGWVLLIAILALALLGGLGPGLFSTRTVVGPAIAVEFDRFGNFRTEEEITVRLDARPGDRGRIAFRISPSFLDRVSIEEIRPEPVEVRSDPEGTTLVFAAPATALTVTVRLDVVPTVPGPVSGRFERPGEGGVEVRQFIYP